jgi:cytochrome c oxidase subunit 2
MLNARIERRSACCAVAILALSGCAGNPSVLEATGPEATDIARLFWLFIGVSAVVYVLVIVALVWAVIRSRRQAAPDMGPTMARSATRLIGGAVAATVLILSGLVVASFAVDRGLLSMQQEPFVEVEVTGHQWWWEIRYLSDDPSKIFRTANELHVPVGRRVKLNLKSADVIHSVWLPNLNGKRDTIPGRGNMMWIEADKPGEWHGRCAEFCGYQHAHMDLTVIAEPLDSFNSWRAAQTEPAHQPETEEQRHGEAVFASSNCVTCHAIRGSLADGQSTIAPDLTHLKSRTMIGAGTAPNSKGFLAGWVADPHGLKPGVNMPTNILSPADFQALLAYLETLE